jgi:hypothetical protein
LLALRQLVQHVGGLVHPAALAAGRGHTSSIASKVERAVGDCELGPDRKPASLQVEEQLLSGLRALSRTPLISPTSSYFPSGVAPMTPAGIAQRHQRSMSSMRIWGTASGIHRPGFERMLGSVWEGIRDIGDDDSELRKSLKEFGWIKELPTIQDENGVTLVGHRRLKIAEEENIEPVIKTLAIGNGDAADAERVKLAIASNIGSKPMTAEDRKRIAQHLYGGREWTMERIPEALNVSTATVGRDLEGFLTMRKPPALKMGVLRAAVVRRSPIRLPPQRSRRSSLQRPRWRPGTDPPTGAGERDVGTEFGPIPRDRPKAKSSTQRLFRKPNRHQPSSRLSRYPRHLYQTN